MELVVKRDGRETYGSRDNRSGGSGVGVELFCVEEER